MAKLCFKEEQISSTYLQDNRAFFTTLKESQIPKYNDVDHDLNGPPQLKVGYWRKGDMLAF